MENVRNRIDVKLVRNKKDYLKWTSKPRYVSHEIFDNDLVAIRKNKVTLTLNKLAYIGMFILEISKALMYEFHYDYFKINMVTTEDYYLRTLISYCMKLKLKISVKILATIKKCLPSVIIQLSQNIMII